MAAKPIQYKKYLLIACGLIIFVSFLLLSLEKFHVINIYHKNMVRGEHPRPVNNIDYSPANSNDNNDINSAKQNGTIVKQPTTKPIDITLTRVYQDINKTLSVRTLVEGQSFGTCVLELTQNGGAPALTKETSIAQQNNIFVCNGFDVQQSELPGLGEWTVKVTASGGGSSDSASQNIILEK